MIKSNVWLTHWSYYKTVNKMFLAMAKKLKGKQFFLWEYEARKFLRV